MMCNLQIVLLYFSEVGNEGLGITDTASAISLEILNEDEDK